MGGYREAIMQAERERNLGQQLADIQATGGQRAYEQALQAFEADRGARLQEAQLGLTAGQAQDQARQEAERLRQSAFGTTEQARQAQQQMAIGSFEAGERARQEAANLGLSAQQQADAARQAKSNSVSHLSSKSFSNVSSKSSQDSKPLSLASKRVNVRLRWGLTHTAGRVSASSTRTV